MLAGSAGPSGPRSLVDPSGGEFVVVAFGVPVPHNPHFTTGDGLLIPAGYHMRRVLGGVQFEGRIDAEDVDAVSLARPSDSQCRPAFSVHVHRSLSDASTGFGPRLASGGLKSADDVWAEAVSVFAPEAAGVARTIGGYGMFGITTAAVQAELCEAAAPPPVDLSRKSCVQ